MTQRPFHCGFVFPHSDPNEVVEAAVAAERAGWDGFFVWEAVWGADPWAMLGAIAVRTERIRLGTMLTPVPVRPPWKLAGETATVDQLSGGRLILAAGLGAVDTGFADFGLPTDRKTRAELLDEGLSILTGLWAGPGYTFRGNHYTVEEPTFMPGPSPVQQRNGKPHVPIWVVGAWGRPKSMQRVLGCDGLLPHMGKPDGSFAALDELPLAEMRTWLDDQAPQGRHIDLIVEGSTSGTDAEAQAATIDPLRAAGVTWWLESNWNADAHEVRARIDRGPPAPSPEG